MFFCFFFVLTNRILDYALNILLTLKKNYGKIVKPIARFSYTSFLIIVTDLRPFQIRNLFLISTFWKIQWGMWFLFFFLFKPFFGCEKSIARSRLNQNKKYTHFGHLALSNTKKKKNRCGAFSRRAR